MRLLTNHPSSLVALYSLARTRRGCNGHLKRTRSQRQHVDVVRTISHVLASSDGTQRSRKLSQTYSLPAKAHVGHTYHARRTLYQRRHVEVIQTIPHVLAPSTRVQRRHVEVIQTLQTYSLRAMARDSSHFCLSSLPASRLGYRRAILCTFLVRIAGDSSPSLEPSR